MVLTLKEVARFRSLRMELHALVAYPVCSTFFSFAFTYFYVADLVIGTCTMCMCIYMYHVRVYSGVDIF